MKTQTFKVTSRLREHYTMPEFKDMLERAAKFAETPREKEFVEHLQDKFDDWGTEMFTSDRQLDWLYSIARYT